jgi:hypothetical protein
MKKLMYVILRVNLIFISLLAQKRCPENLDVIKNSLKDFFEIDGK